VTGEESDDSVNVSVNHDDVEVVQRHGQHTTVYHTHTHGQHTTVYDDITDTSTRHHLTSVDTQLDSYIRVHAVVWAYGRGHTDRQTHRRA